MESVGEAFRQDIKDNEEVSGLLWWCAGFRRVINQSTKALFLALVLVLHIRTIRTFTIDVGFYEMVSLVIGIESSHHQMIFSNLEAGWLSLSLVCSLIYWPCHNTHNQPIYHRVWKTQTNRCMSLDRTRNTKFHCNCFGHSLYQSRLSVHGAGAGHGHWSYLFTLLYAMLSRNCQWSGREEVIWRSSDWPCCDVPKSLSCVMSWWFSDSLVWRDNSL